MSVFVLLKHKNSSGDPVEIEVIGADSAEITTGSLMYIALNVKIMAT